VRQAVILAGGKGTRLKDRLNGLPKPLIDICGTPLLERQIELCVRQGFTNILILVNYAADKIAEFCASKQNWGIEVECIDDGEPRGTAGAVLAILDRLDPEFLVMYGDTMLEVGLTRFAVFHRSKNADATLFLHPNDHPQDSDLVEIDDEARVVALHPYPHEPGRYYHNLVNAALYMIRRDALERWSGLPGMLDFGKDIFPRMLEAGHSLCGYNSPEYIKDAGTPARLDKVCADYASGKIARSSLSVPQPIVFLDRDGVINPDMVHLDNAEDFRLFDGVGVAVKKLNEAGYRTVVVTNQPVVARGGCTLAELDQIHAKMEWLLGESGAYLNRVYFCPHHPDKGFPGEVPELKIVCGCRKPATGMVERARAELNGDFANSWVIGDTSTDMQLARNAGIRSVFVQTAGPEVDFKYPARADFIVPDLSAAVAFILDDYPPLSDWAAGFANKLGPGTLVYIGGTPSSGKTTVAAALRLALQANGRRCIVLSERRWLTIGQLDEQVHLSTSDGLAMIALAELLGNCKGPVAVDLPVVDQQPGTVERIVIGEEDVVVFEGPSVPVLSQATPGETIFVDAPEDLKRSRFLWDEHAHRSNESAENLNDLRLRREQGIIEQTRALACYELVLPLRETHGH